MNGLDMNHIDSYSDKELAVFLESSTDPLIKDCCRRFHAGRDKDIDIRNLEEENEGLTDEKTKLSEDLEETEESLKTARDEIDSNEKWTRQQEDLLAEKGIPLPGSRAHA